MRFEGIIARSDGPNLRDRDFMDQLIAGIAAKTGIDEATARSAVGIILNMFVKEGPGDKVSALMSAMPGASDLLAAQQSGDAASEGANESDPSDVDFSSSLGGIIGGALGDSNPVMDTLAELQDQGLSMEQAIQVGQEVAGYAREKAGDDIVREIASSIPGLSAVL